MPQLIHRVCSSLISPLPPTPFCAVAVTASAAPLACPDPRTPKCFTAWALAYTGYNPSKAKFVSPTDAAWGAFARELGLTTGMAGLKNFEMVLNQVLRGQEKPGATSSKVKIGAQTICNLCEDDPGLRICKPCKKAGRA